MLDGASAELPDEKNTGDVAEWRPRRLDPEIPWAQEGGYAATSRRLNLVSLVASAAVTTAMIVAIMQAGFVTLVVRQPEPVVLDLIALPSSAPAEPPRSEEPKSAEPPVQNVAPSPIVLSCTEK